MRGSVLLHAVQQLRPPGRRVELHQAGEAVGEQRRAINLVVRPLAKLGLTGVPQQRGLLTANRARAITFAADGLAPGRYVLAIRFAVAMNPARSTTVIGDSFVVR